MSFATYPNRTAKVEASQWIVSVAGAVSERGPVAAQLESLWVLHKRGECHEAELVTLGDVCLLDFRRDGRRVCRVSYASREDALRDAHNYRVGLEISGWSEPQLAFDGAVS